MATVALSQAMALRVIRDGPQRFMSTTAVPWLTRAPCLADCSRMRRTIFSCSQTWKSTSLSWSVCSSTRSVRQSPNLLHTTGRPCLSSDSIQVGMYHCMSASGAPRTAEGSWAAMWATSLSARQAMSSRRRASALSTSNWRARRKRRRRPSSSSAGRGASAMTRAARASSASTRARRSSRAAPWAAERLPCQPGRGRGELGW
mmetsp:Transcript_13162/g.44591  ORF Transcript_13162/g.44591 Transcript_13162/m.44591 type:complete len:202 (-) Transcript_13162:215-820(-)